MVFPSFRSRVDRNKPHETCASYYTEVHNDTINRVRNYNGNRQMDTI